MVQTLSRESNLAQMPVLDALVIDEAHHARADSYMRVIDHARSLNPSLKLLGMTATPNVIAQEIRRTSTLRNVTLPFTLPGLPDVWRQTGLKLLQWAKAQRGSKGGDITFGANDVWIGKDADPSVNICIRATK